MALKPGYKQTDVGVIPDDWQVSSVGAMGEVRAGKALATRGAGQQRPYLRTKNVFDGWIDLNDVLRMPMTKAEFSRYRLRHGDVLLNEGQSLELVGRCAMYKDEYPEPCAIQNQLVRFRARDGVSPGFATQLFRHCQNSGVFTRIALQTTSVAHLGVSRLHRLQLAWPLEPVEQEAIAEALNDADTLIESLEQLIGKQRDLKQAAMQELLRPKVGWVAKRLGESCEIVTKGTTPTSIGKAYSSSGINFLKAESISESGQPIPSKMAFIDESTHRLLKRSQLRAGDILISIAGVLGRVGLVERDVVPANTNQALAIIRLGKESEFERDYLFYYLRSSMIERQISDINVQAAQANISLQNVRDFQIIVPILRRDQTAIAAVLSDMDAEIAALEQRQAKTRALKQGMMQELLTGRIRLV